MRQAFTKPQAVGPSTASADIDAADRAHRMQVGTVATATGRSPEDVNRSLMAGNVVGQPARFARKAAASFRAELHHSTMLGGFRR